MLRCLSRTLQSHWPSLPGRGLRVRACGRPRVCCRVNDLDSTCPKFEGLHRDMKQTFGYSHGPLNTALWYFGTSGQNETESFREKISQGKDINQPEVHVGPPGGWAPQTGTVCPLSIGPATPHQRLAARLAAPRSQRARVRARRWHPSRRPAENSVEARRAADYCRWQSFPSI